MSKDILLTQEKYSVGKELSETFGMVSVIQTQYVGLQGLLLRKLDSEFDDSALEKLKKSAIELGADVVHSIDRQFVVSASQGDINNGSTHLVAISYAGEAGLLNLES